MTSDRILAGSVIVTATAFAALGAVSRYTFRDVETRWQIAAFAGAAVAIELGRRLADARPSWLRAAAGAGAAAIVVTLVKFDLEPQVLRQDRAVAKAVAVRAEQSVIR